MKLIRSALGRSCQNYGNGIAHLAQKLLSCLTGTLTIVDVLHQQKIYPQSLSFVRYIHYTIIYGFSLLAPYPSSCSLAAFLVD
jgi:hypothetical protein